MKILQCGLFLLCASMSLPLLADTVKTDDVIVPGGSGVCVGFDCGNGEDFALGTFKLKENNTRIRLYDSSASPGDAVRQILPNAYVEGYVGESWRMDANQTASGGSDAFYINQQSLGTYVVLSDGSAPDYDCSDPFAPPELVGTIPEGQPVENQNNCTQIEQFLQRDGLVLGNSASSGAAVGLDAELADGEVSLGNTSLKRRLVHVAEALAESDVLIKSQLDAGVFMDEQARLDEVEALINTAEQEIAALEAVVNKPSGGGGSGAMGWLILLLPLLGLAKRPRRRMV